jgi:sortase (surface protein transpeptidase)
MTTLRRLAIVAFAGGLVLLAFGLFVGFGGSDAEEDDIVPTFDLVATATSTPRATPTPSATATASPTAVPTATPTPFDGAVSRLLIPRFDVDSLIENIGLTPDNVLETPDNPHNTGWYDIYDRPGWGGNAVFSAHVDYYPNIRGPFYNLAKVEAGDEVVVIMENGLEYRYEVVRKQRYDVNTIPMGDLIWPNDRPAGEEWVTLITCGGRFQPNNGTSGPGQYLDRDVVVARRVASPGQAAAAVPVQ